MVSALPLRRMFALFLERRMNPAKSATESMADEAGSHIERYRDFSRGASSYGDYWPYYIKTFTR